MENDGTSNKKLLVARDNEGCGKIHGGM